MFSGRVAGLNYTGSYKVSSVFLSLLCPQKPVALRVRFTSVLFCVQRRSSSVVGRGYCCEKPLIFWLRFAMPLFKVFSQRHYSFRRLLLSFRLRLGCSASLDFIYFAPYVAYQPCVSHSAWLRGRKSHSHPAHLHSDRPATSKQAQKKHSFHFCFFCTCLGSKFFYSANGKIKKVKKKKV